MKCRHKNVSDKYGETTHDWNGDIIYEVEFRECLDCGHWLGLGPSRDDDPRVAFEVRAAELATEHDISAAWIVGRISDTERDGWSCTETNMADHSDAWHAGYLARQITEGE